MTMHNMLTLAVAAFCSLLLTNGIAAFRTIVNATHEEKREKIQVGHMHMTMRRYMTGEGIGYILTSAVTIMSWLLFITR
ncbi:MAG: hypothetical protein QM578_05920 [Pantoea sp.]|uniref:Uncharacterized protein n=1 Tax=Pantoea phytobeneficialis TaxID=2052056 RepID=A0AAP9H522_9GAMM|nr:MULTISPECIES: hypothetical protein [Pantoea]ERK17633.1 hypothetical protein L579_3514 [Pantoea sp. AS-PWVM4]MDO6405645.1 hypothetical protein [Pantoea phytobeneficialis]QGR06712.1 hypothetical protein CTZ24_09930 [Pantoea phytobeneficialis]